MKYVFNNDNVLYIIRGLHQNHVFLIKDKSTLFLEELAPLVSPLSGKVERMIFFDLPQHIPILIMTQNYEIFYMQQP